MKRFLIIILICLCLTAHAEEIIFGSYWQDSIVEKTSITWLVLDKQDDKVLLLSKYCLDAHRFGSMLYSCLWHNSEIRAFLNTEFYNWAFTDEEKVHIIKTTINTNVNSFYTNKWRLKTTEDYVFLLSMQEAEQYLTAADRIAYATYVAKTYTSDDEWAGVATTKKGTVHWWLRTVGVTDYYATFVNPQGKICYDGELVYAPHYGIRPAIWVDSQVLGRD